MSASRHHAAAAGNLVSALLLTVAGLFAVPAAALADPCEMPPFDGCATAPGAFRIKYNISSSAALTNIVDMWGGPFAYAGPQGDFPADGQVSLQAGGGVIDAGIWFGDDQHYLVGLTSVGGTDHLVVMMNPTAAASATGFILEDIINGNPVDPTVQIPAGAAESLIITSLKTQPVEWDTDIDQFFRYSSRYPNRVLPALLINATGTYDIGSGAPADFVMVMYSTGTVIGSASVEIVPVPEPATWLSLLAGAGLLGLRLRSTRRRTSARTIVGD